MLGMWAYQPRPNMSRPQKKKKNPRCMAFHLRPACLRFIYFSKLSKWCIIYNLNFYDQKVVGKNRVRIILHLKIYFELFFDQKHLKISQISNWTCLCLQITWKSIKKKKKSNLKSTKFQISDLVFQVILRWKNTSTKLFSYKKICWH